MLKAARLDSRYRVCIMSCPRTNTTTTSGWVEATASWRGYRRAIQLLNQWSLLSWPCIILYSVMSLPAPISAWLALCQSGFARLKTFKPYSAYFCSASGVLRLYRLRPRNTTLAASCEALLSALYCHGLTPVFQLQLQHTIIMSRFTLYSSQSQDLVSSTAWDDNLETYFTHLFNQAKGARTVWWLDVCDATEDDVSTVAQALSVHPLSVEDIATREPREKVEVFRNYYLISFQTLVSKAEDKDEQVFKAPSSAVFFILVFMNGVLTFSPSGCSHVHRVRDRIRKMYDPAILSSDWICYALMYISLPSYIEEHSLTKAETTSSTASPRTCKPRHANPKPSKTKCSSCAPTTSRPSSRASTTFARKSCV